MLWPRMVNECEYRYMYECTKCKVHGIAVKASTAGTTIFNRNQSNGMRIIRHLLFCATVTIYYIECLTDLHNSFGEM